MNPIWALARIFNMEVVTWHIPHPGTLEKCKCASFEEAMDEWFEGFNIPVKSINGVPEPFSESYKRVKDYYAKPRKD